MKILTAAVLAAALAVLSAHCLADSKQANLPTSRPAKTSRRQAMVRASRLRQAMTGLFKRKRYAEAAAACEQGLQLPLPAAMKASFGYNLACAQARLGKKSEALASLEAAVELGWDNADHLQKDPDLAGLRADKRFAAMVKRLTAGIAPKITRSPDVTLIEGKPGGGLHYRIRMSPKATAKSPHRLIVWLHPAGGLMNNVVEKLAPVLNKHGFALMVFTRKNRLSWSSADGGRMLKTVEGTGRIPGLDADKPILMGYSAGGQMALILWAEKPGRFGGLILDAAYPVDMKAYRRGQVKVIPLPDDEAVRDVPFFVVVGTLDGGSQVWKMAEKKWKDANVPLHVIYVEGARHAWLFNAERIRALETWLDKRRDGFVNRKRKAQSDTPANNDKKTVPSAAASTAPAPQPLIKDGGEANWTPLPAMTDEFEGRALDKAKWHPRNPTWKGRKPGFFSTRNVTVSDGKMHITMKAEKLPDLPEGYHTFTCGAVKSKTTVLYGFFEAKCRAMDSRGSSAFWFYDSTPEIHTEIDVFEIGGRAPKHERAVHMNVHVFRTPKEKNHWSKPTTWKAPFRLADGYHVYGLDWNKDQIKFYVDGTLVRTVKNTHWHQPLYLNFDSETMPKWFSLPKVENLPSTFSTEYIRAWKRADKPAAGQK